MADLARLMRPRSVAVFGGAWAREVIRQMRRMGYEGDIWPVHPDKAEVEGLKAYPSIAALPGAPDASFIGVNRFQTIALVAELREIGAGGAVCFASGFSEVGAQGEALQGALVEAAGDMAVLGPNCYGFINALDGALLWPDMHGCERVTRGVAIVTQSSNIAINLTMARRGLPIAYVVCLGNQAVTGLPDAIAGLAADERVSVIVLHIEAIRDPVAFAAAAAIARAAGKPLVALRVGRSDTARAMTMTHTASLAGNSAVASAFLARCGIAEVMSIPDLIEAAKLLHVLGPLPPGGLVTLSCSGGEASIMADAADRAGVAMPAFAPTAEEAIRATVNPLVTVSNPFDYHTFDWGAGDRLLPTFSAVMAGGQSLTALVLDFPREGLGDVAGWDVALDAFVTAANSMAARAAVIATVPECLPEDRCRRLVAMGVVPLQGVSEAMAAIAVAEVAAGASELAPYMPLQPHADPGDDCVLGEWDAKQALAAFGVSIPGGRLCRTETETIAAVLALAPAAMKVSGSDHAHKTEVGGVKLNLRHEADARAAYAALSRIGPTVLVERMADRPIAELIIGAARDPALGLYMILGAGGVLAELLADTAVLTLPTTREEIRTALAGLRVSRLLAGWRGGPAANIAAIVAEIEAIGNYVVAHAAALQELDVNPLIVTADGAVAVDALIRLKRSTAEPLIERAKP